MDFTIITYKKLLIELIDKDFVFQTFDEFIREPKSKSIILRHDVDLLPHNSLSFAKIQAQNKVKGVYYFRAVPQSWDEKVIKEISDLGHEIGYHYECLTTTSGDLEKGIKDFEKNLNALRKLAPVSTICMHGSPMSRHDSKDLWKEYNYKDFGIIGEPYFDIDFTKVLYLTDTGRKWDGDKVSVRDKVNSNFGAKFHSTDDIIEAAQNKKLNHQIMFTFHPQRWNDNKYLWTKELIAQCIKNKIKELFFVKDK
jgi:hypothetical protein